MNNKDNRAIEPKPMFQCWYPPPINQVDDEISAVNFFKSLRARKFKIIAIFFGIIFLGCGYALLKQDVYNYATALTIGSVVEEGKPIPVDHIKNIESELKEIYIPSVLDEFYRQHPGKSKTMKIDVTVPKDSRLILLNGRSSLEDGAIYQDLMMQAVTKLVRHHNEIIKTQRDLLEMQVAGATKRIRMLIDNESNINQKIDALSAGLKSMSNDKNGTTALMIIGLSAQKQQIEEQKFTLETELAKARAALSLIRETTQSLPVARSKEPVGLGKTSVVLISAILGFLIAVVFALISDYVAKMKKLYENLNVS